MGNHRQSVRSRVFPDDPVPLVISGKAVEAGVNLDADEAVVPQAGIHRRQGCLLLTRIVHRKKRYAPARFLVGFDGGCPGLGEAAGKPVVMYRIGPVNAEPIHQPEDIGQLPAVHKQGPWSPKVHVCINNAHPLHERTSEIIRRMLPPAMACLSSCDSSAWSSSPRGTNGSLAGTKVPKTSLSAPNVFTVYSIIPWAQ